MTRSRRRTAAKLQPYWGYALLILLYGAITQGADAGLLAVGSGVLLFYSLFLVPKPCGAPNRVEGDFCRNNSHGLVRGCYLRSHRWSNFYRSVVGHKWRELTRGLWDTPGARLMTAGAVATLVSSLVGLVAAVTSALL